MIEVYAEKCSPSLKVSDITIGGKVLMNAVTEMIIKKVVTVCFTRFPSNLSGSSVTIYTAVIITHDTRDNVYNAVVMTKLL